jgi:hypothetical protein
MMEIFILPLTFILRCMNKIFVDSKTMTCKLQSMKRSTSMYLISDNFMFGSFIKIFSKIAKESGI